MLRLGACGTVLETGDYDIQTTDPKAIEKYDIEKLGLGDVVCLKDQLCINGRGYYKGAVTIGWSSTARATTPAMGPE